MTHLNAIHSAFVGLQNRSEEELVLIIDGEIALGSDFAQFVKFQWVECLQSAPKDWKLLQLVTAAQPGSVLFDHSKHISDYWISWQGDHIGSSAYFINIGCETFSTHDTISPTPISHMDRTRMGRPSVARGYLFTKLQRIRQCAHGSGATAIPSVHVHHARNFI